MAGRSSLNFLIQPQRLRGEIPTTPIEQFDFDAMQEDEQAEFWVPAARLAETVNPLRDPPWLGVERAIRPRDVIDAIHDGHLVSRHVGAAETGDGVPSDLAWALHVGRIAQFVVHMPEDAVTIDVGMPDFGYTHLGDFIVEDGHHRLAAAIVRQDDLLVTFSGSFQRFQQLFPQAHGFARRIDCADELAELPHSTPVR